MPIKKIHSQAIRLNGFTDGMVVPTGAFRESGVDLYAASHTEKTGSTNKVPSYNSDEPKIGLRHIPNEGNGLNNIIGPFTIEAFVIPDKGGVVVHKENCYTLSIGEPHKQGKASFVVHTRSISGENNGEQVETPYDFPSTENISLWGGQSAYFDSSSDLLPHDLDLPNQPLIYLNAQFTGSDIRLYINGDLVAKQDFGGEERILQSSSSDLFIGGRGGEFRGVIESVRISRGTIAPKLQQFTKTPVTMGLWDFEDEDDIPDIYFFNNKSPSHSYAGADGVGQNDDEMPYPMVCVGYDFNNVTVSGTITTPITLAAGYNYGRFKIRNFPGSAPTALKMIASHMLSVPIDELPLQSWWNNGAGYLDVGATVTKARYHADGLPVSNLNAVINASGTDPITGGSFSSFDYNSTNLDPSGGISLNPMANPIERIRIIALDFTTDEVIVQSSFLQGTTADAKTTGFLFSHPDNTPVWFTLGNADLMIDPGNDARPKGQMTRARFTQGQRFEDRSGFGNEAYFIGTQSRNVEEMLTQAQNTGGLVANTNYPPIETTLMLWLDADDGSSMMKGTMEPIMTEEGSGAYPVWWTSKAPKAPNYHFYGGNRVGTAWRWIKNCANVNSRGGLQVSFGGEQVDANAEAQELQDMFQQMTPLQPVVPITGMWANGKGAFGEPGRIPGFDGETGGPIAFAIEHASTIDGSTPTNNGDFTFYFVLTPAYATATATLALIQNAGYGIDFRLDNGSGVPKVTYSNLTNTMLAAGKPAAGVPCLIAITVNGSENGSYNLYNKANGHTPVYTKTFSGTPNANLTFSGNNNVSTAGLELFGIFNHNAGGGGPGDNATVADAYEGLTVHEVMIYAGAHTTTQQADVRQWIEDKWGI